MVKFQKSFKSHYPLNKLSQLPDRYVLAVSDVHVRATHVQLGPELVPWDVQKEHTGVGEVIREQEFTPDIPGPPDGDRGVSLELSLVEPSDQRG